jgi:hypothetical protein
MLNFCGNMLHVKAYVNVSGATYAGDGTARGVCCQARDRLHNAPTCARAPHVQHKRIEARHTQTDQNRQEKCDKEAKRVVMLQLTDGVCG